jgi:hypothetical protein
VNRHPFRWSYLLFATLFLAVVAGWAVWREDLLTGRELSLSASGVLIALGLVGIAATLRQARPGRPTPSHPPVPEGDPHDQAADPLA